MEILAAFYYIIGLILTLPNIYIVLNGVNWISGAKEKSKNEDERRGVDFFGCLFIIPTILWFLVGLLTAQWFFFLAYLGISGFLYFIRDKFLSESLKGGVYRLEAFFELVFILFVVLNHFHFHLTVNLM